jgi:curved DNA-binding protein
MKYKDYYQTLGLGKTATSAEIKQAYRKLAHQYHPDVSPDPQGEEKFKQVAEAYATLKNPEKREQYDNLPAPRNGDSFTPPPEWQQRYGANAAAFDDVDLADLMQALRSAQGSGHRSAGNGFAGSGHEHGHEHGQEHASFYQPGEDYAITLPVSIDTLYQGGTSELSLHMPEVDERGLPHRVARTFQITIPKGTLPGQRLRLCGQGEPGHNGSKAGDLYVTVALAPHPLFRVNGRDLYLDLPLAPWEAVLGGPVRLPTPGGPLELMIRPGTANRQKLRLIGRGLPSAKGSSGDLFAVVQIVLPGSASDEELGLYRQLAVLAEGQHFAPRAAFPFS